MATTARGLGFFGARDRRCSWNFRLGIACHTIRIAAIAAIVAQRMTALGEAGRACRAATSPPCCCSPPLNAILRSAFPRARTGRAAINCSLAPGNVAADGPAITQWLELNGFNRASTVREPGDYAIRGGIIDLFAPGMGEPVRLDFFGDQLESIRSFDPDTQRTSGDLRALNLVPMAEFQLTSDYHQAIPAPAMSQPSARRRPTTCSYEAVSEGRRHAGMEH